MSKKLTDEQRSRILSLRHKRTQADIAAMVGVSTAIVSLVLNGKHQASISRNAPIETKLKPTLPARADPLPEVPDAIPETAELALVDRWIALVEEAAQAARADGNMSAFASLAQKLVALMEHKRKVTPVAKEDPNDNIDMIALGDQVWARLTKALARK